MKLAIPHWLIPINIFEIQANICCLAMYNNIAEKQITRQFLCYEARSIQESNMCIIWGAISPKLGDRLTSYLRYMPKGRSLVHITGCHEPHNLMLPRVFTIDHCILQNSDIQYVLSEARQCLTA